MALPRSRLSTLVMTAFLAACGGSDGPTDPGNDDDGGGTTRQIKTNPAFAADIQEIFQRRGCTASGCHGGGAGGMTLGGSASADYGMLVGVASSSESSFQRVAPNDAVNSYLVMKLEGRQSVGSRMPLGGSPLDNTDLTNIKNWIDTGAPNN